MSQSLKQFGPFPPPAEMQDACVKAMVQCIVEAVNPRRVILFGSRARGDCTPESDVDLLIEMDGRLGPDEILETTGRAGCSVAKSPLPKDLVVLGSEQVEEQRDCWHSVVHQALAEGRVLHARLA